MESILVVGLHTRPAVFSARALGMKVYSVDYFGSVDLRGAADISRSIIHQMPGVSMGRISENYSDSKLAHLARDLEADKIVLTSTVILGRKTLGTPPKRMKRIKDKAWQLKRVENLGVPVPRWVEVHSKEDVGEAAEEIGYPLVLKPAIGDGGKRIILVRGANEIPDVTERCIAQEYVRGKPMSVSTLSTGSEDMAISTSLQILGARFLNQTGFAYCGNIVPYECGPEPIRMAEAITGEFGVLGWNGVDFVDTGKGAVFMELNPRFQGTHDCIEMVYGYNIIDSHIGACEGALPEKRVPKGYAVRFTLYSKYRATVSGDLRGVSRDVPLPGVITESGEPITTVVTWAEVRKVALKRARGTVADVYKNYLTPL
ncbi:MAG: ATP-grasp domain-containing protein [Candidatus Hydrothermarchaeaceae archaeon]